MASRPARAVNSAWLDAARPAVPDLAHKLSASLDHRPECSPEHDIFLVEKARLMRTSSSIRLGRGAIVFLSALVGLGLFCIGLQLSVPVTSHAQQPHQTATPTLPPGTGSVSGIAWEDLNGNGRHDAGEPPRSGVLVTVRNALVTAAATSGTDGAYRLAGLLPGVYRLAAVPPTGYLLTTPTDFDILVSADAVLTVDFGVVFLPTPTPSATAPPILDIGSATQAYCGGVYSNDTRTGANNVSRYGCRSAWDESGPEVVYRIELDQSQPLSATLLAADTDLDLFLLRYAYPDSCIAAGDNALSAEAEAGAYFLVVDGFQGTAGSFTLRLTCPDAIQATRTHTPTPSPTPTVTITPTPGPSATPTVTSMPQPVFLPLLLHQVSQGEAGDATLTFQQDVDGYTGVADTTLDAWNPAEAFGADRELRLAYARPPKVTTQMAPVLRFDTGMLPIDAEVIQAQLKLYLLASARNDLRGEVHLLLRDWNEQTATWQQPRTGEHWAQEGAQGAGSDFAEPGLDSQLIWQGKRWYTFEVTPGVSAWVREPLQNRGVIVMARAGDGATNVQSGFASSNYPNPALRPQLVVNYRLTDRSLTH